MWKPIRIFATALGLALAATSLAFAEHEHGPGKMGEDIAMGMKHQCCGPMGMGGHGGSNLVATSDGGVVVRCGNELIKYDKNLKLVKSVEIECAKCCKKDSASAEGGMGEMGMCHKPGKSGMMEKSVEPKKAEEAKPKTPAAPVTPSAPAPAPAKK